MSNLLSLAAKLETKHFHKTANSPQAFYHVIKNYDAGAPLLQDFAEGMKMSADLFAQESNMDDPNDRRIYEILLKQANLVFNLIPEMDALDREMDQWNHFWSLYTLLRINGGLGWTPIMKRL